MRRNNRNQSEVPVQVESPEIASINVTAQRISQWLHNDFVEVVKPLQVLPELPGILEDFKNRLVDQFRIHFSGQVAVQMKAREVNIKVAERKHHFLEGQVDRRWAIKRQQTERIETRFNNLAEQIAHEHSSFLRQLDQHVYQIVDEIFPEQIQAKFSFISQPFWYELARRAALSSVARSHCLNEGYEDTRHAVERFLQARQSVYEQVGALDSGLQPGYYEIPYWYAVVEDLETGEQSAQLAFPKGFEPGDAADSTGDARLRDVATELLHSGIFPTLPPEVAEQVAQVAIDEFGVAPEQIARFMEAYGGNGESGAAG